MAFHPTPIQSELLRSIGYLQDQQTISVRASVPLINQQRGFVRTVLVLESIPEIVAATEPMSRPFCWDMQAEAMRLRDRGYLRFCVSPLHSLHCVNQPIPIRSLLPLTIVNSKNQVATLNLESDNCCIRVEIDGCEAARFHIGGEHFFMNLTAQGLAVLDDIAPDPAKTEQDGTRWVPAHVIITKGYCRSAGTLTKMSKAHPAIRRSATDTDREYYTDNRLLYVYDIISIYELTEGKRDRLSTRPAGN